MSCSRPFDYTYADYNYCSHVTCGGESDYKVANYSLLLKVLFMDQPDSFVEF